VTVAAVLGAALALSACSSSPLSGVLIQTDIPRYLGVKADQSASASDARSVRTAPCQAANAAVFDGSWKHLKSGPSSIPIIISAALSCATVSQAQQFFNTIKIGANGYPSSVVTGHAVAGVGDEAC